jgi:hypothetical protein
VSRAVRTSDALITAARAATGLDDLGDDSFREWLDLLIESANADIDFHASGVDVVEATIVRSLSNRLQVEQWYRDHPETAGTTVAGPVLITGLPRSGTTALVGMLAQDPAFRALRGWEAAQPCPPPELGREDDDPRVDAARALADALPPEIVAMHIVDPLGPEEDHDVLNLGFCAAHYSGFWPVYRYPMQWLHADMASAFAYHERVLKLLAARRGPNDWLLKQPLHVFSLEAFAARYPDARFVMTHRDPTKAVPSVCSLMSWSYQTVTDRVDLARHGRFQLEYWAEGISRAMTARARLGEHRFVDVVHDDLVADPEGEITRIYQFLGRAPTDDARSAISTYIADHRSDAASAHTYTAEEFGLRAPDIRSVFSDYVSRFAL